MKRIKNTSNISSKGNIVYVIILIVATCLFAFNLISAEANIALVAVALATWSMINSKGALDNTELLQNQIDILLLQLEDSDKELAKCKELISTCLICDEDLK